MFSTRSISLTTARVARRFRLLDYDLPPQITQASAVAAIADDCRVEDREPPHSALLVAAAAVCVPVGHSPSRAALPCRPPSARPPLSLPRKPPSVSDGSWHSAAPRCQHDRPLRLP